MTIEEFRERVKKADAEELDLLLKSYRKVWCMHSEASFIQYLNKIDMSLPYEEYLKNFKDNILEWLYIETSGTGKMARKILALDPLEEIPLLKKDNLN